MVLDIARRRLRRKATTSQRRGRQEVFVWEIVCRFFGWEGYDKPVEMPLDSVLSGVEVANVACSS
jgi:hypothetical protein